MTGPTERPPPLPLHPWHYTCSSPPLTPHPSRYCKEKNLIGDYDGAFFRNLPSQSEFKKVHSLSVDEKWQMLLLSGVAAHVPLEPALNPQGDTSYTKCAAASLAPSGSHALSRG